MNVATATLPALGRSNEVSGLWLNGKPAEHVSALDRLLEGCRRLRIPTPARHTLEQEIGEAARGCKRAVLKLMVTRGEGARGYRPAREVHHARLLLRFPWTDYPAMWQETGVHVHLCSTHFGHNKALAGLKHLNRLEQVLAQSEWGDLDDIQEGLMTDEDGSVISGTASNVFAWLPHGVLATPSLRLCGVEGVMRRYLLQRAEEAGMQQRIATISLPELMSAHEIFLTNTLIGVWPVANIGHWKYSIGSVTRQMQAWVAECETEDYGHD